MKIVFVSPLTLAIPDVQGGAIERLMTMLVQENELYNEHEFFVISTYNQEAKLIAEKYKHSKVFYVKRVNLFVQRLYSFFIAVFHKITKINVPLTDLNYIKVNRIINRIKPDAIVVEGSGGENFYFMSKRYGKDKFYLHLHSEYLPNEILDKTFGNIISVSDYINSKWIYKTSNKTLHSFVVKNCIDERRFSTKISIEDANCIREKLGYTKNDFVVLFCGRIIKEKGVKELLQAFKKFDNPNIKLLMIGSPNFGVKSETEYSKQIGYMVKQLKTIQWIGYVDNSNLYKYYQIADMMVIPSICEEAFPLTPIEGITCGLPILATRSGGLPETVSPECSVLIEKDEQIVDNLYKQINYLYSHPQKRELMHRAAVKKADMFSIKKYYFDFIGVFEH